MQRRNCHDSTEKPAPPRIYLIAHDVVAPATCAHNAAGRTLTQALGKNGLDRNRLLDRRLTGGSFLDESSALGSRCIHMLICASSSGIVQQSHAAAAVWLRGRDKEGKRPVHLVLKKLARALAEFGTYIDNIASGIVNYGYCRSEFK
jgi:hypothetical protein